MLKKAGLLTVGVTAGLLAVAPIASAGEAESVKGEHDKDSSKHEDHGKKKHHGKKHDGDQDGVGNVKCGAKSDGFENNPEAGDSTLASTGQITGAALSGNTGQLLSCNAFLNDVLSGNDVNVG